MRFKLFVMPYSRKDWINIPCKIGIAPFFLYVLAGKSFSRRGFFFGTIGCAESWGWNGKSLFFYLFLMLCCDVNWTRAWSKKFPNNFNSIEQSYLVHFRHLGDVSIKPENLRNSTHTELRISSIWHILQNNFLNITTHKLLEQNY